ncbi:MAG: glycine oxidase ThiO [Bacteroidota bacterium]|nr:glycine oxidase ThiO [Bacteroidota bacterium]MDP4231827.1 glycine oxidase ThiO [Bacteroidota bacterium]MDP4242713.1 glycine oxidase ThiO [Bacteroidota bacterium]MDP4287164.1 glycine oxidase ThiO [Bacteroidota bacterium]
MSNHPHVIVGGGIIGLSIGWELLRNGAEHVEIYEAGEAVRSGATWVAAGMLAPRAEANFEEVGIYHAGVASLNAYPDFLARLEEDANEVPRLDTCGSLMIATNIDDKRELDRQFEFRKRIGCPAERLDGTAAREREPLLGPRVTSALWLDGDAQINNRTLALALKQAYLKRGGLLHEHTRVQAVTRDGDRLGVRTSSSLPALELEFAHTQAATVTIATGANVQIEGIDPIPVRPVKGQMIGLRAEPFAMLRQPILATKAYLVPKDDTRLLIGTTAEEVGFDKRVTAGPILNILHRAWEMVPAIYELEIEEILTGFRPTPRDHKPIVGRGTTDNLYYATGHYRHGILHAPLAARMIADLIVANKWDARFDEFLPSRFLSKKEPVAA